MLKKLTSTNTLVVIGIILGIAFGIFFPSLALKQKLIGDMFIAFLKMIVVPLVFASIYISILTLGSIERLKTIGLKTIGLYLLTTALATFSAIIAMDTFDIADKINITNIHHASTPNLKPFSFSEMILSFIPTNIFHAFANTSMMQIIVFAILFGIASLHLRSELRNTMEYFFTGVSEAMLKIAQWIILLTPLGVFSLISYVVANQGIDVLLGLWKYMLMVVGVILFHGIITLPAILAFFGRINPYRYLSQIRDAPIMAFSTASSASTLPVSMKVCEEMGGVDKKTVSFVLPLGATVSMDGTAAYLSIAILYIAKIAGANLGFADQILLGITVVALSVGVAALPSASLVMMVVILNKLGLPIEYMAVIIAVDRILDMCRTSLNVTSDLIVAKSVDQIQKRQTKQDLTN